MMQITNRKPSKDWQVWENEGGMLGEILRAKEGLFAKAMDFLGVSTIVRPTTKSHSIVYYYFTICCGLLSFFWFLYWKKANIKQLIQLALQTGKDLMETAFTYDRSSINQPRRRRMGY